MATHDVGSKDGASLTKAAVQTLDELLSQRRQEVLAEAVSATKGREITAADVVRAYYSDAGRPLLYDTTGMSDQLRRRQIVIFAATAFMAIIALLIIVLVSRLSGVGDQSPNDLSFIGAMVGLVVAIASASAAAFLQYRFARRSRESHEKMLQIVAHGSEIGNSSKTQSKLRSLNEAQQRGLFLTKWVSVEEDLRQLAVLLRPDAEQESRSFEPIGSLMRDLTSAGIIDPELSSNIRQVVTVRNKVAHQESVSQGQLEAGLGLLDKVDDRLSELRKSMS